MKVACDLKSKEVIMDFVVYLLRIGERGEALATMQVGNPCVIAMSDCLP